jgi:hypothetical protein
MTQQHPIVPPPELIQQWDDEATEMFRPEYQLHLTTRAAQWGADAELEACCEWLRQVVGKLASRKLRAARRPKLLSSKELALEELEQLRRDAKSMGMGFDAPAIRRALKQLPDDQ